MIDQEYTILVADDQSEIINSVKSYLTHLAQKFRKNIKIFEANSGSKVLEILDNNQVDAVFLDYYFENGINGDEIIQYIYDPFGVKFIVLMSGWKAEEIESVVIKSHMQFRERFKFIRKPFEFIEIQDKFLEFLDYFENRPYPSPIHYVYDALQTSSNHFARITAIKDFFETFTKYSTSILMSDLKRLDLSRNLSLNIN